MEKITLGAIIAACCVWALKEIYSLKSRSTEKNIEATLQNTLALVELKVEVTGLKNILSSVPKMQSDINEAHARIRELNAAMKSRENGEV